jgi:hypothetical protein
MRRRISGFGGVLLAALLIGALLPATAFAAKPTLSVNVTSCDVAANSTSGWTVTASASWTGAPGGTDPVPYVNTVWSNGSNPVSSNHPAGDFSTTTAGHGAGSITASIPIPTSGWVGVGATVYFVLGFQSHNGSEKTNITYVCGNLP